MYIVKDDNPDVGYAVDFTVTDAEGIPLPSDAVDLVIVSDNPSAVELTPNTDDPKKGSAHFGSPGNAAITCTVALKDGTVIGSFGAQFTVTAGEPAAISGGNIVFDGLTEV